MTQRLAVITTDAHVGSQGTDLSEYFDPQHRPVYAEQRALMSQLPDAGSFMATLMDSHFFMPDAVQAQQEERRRTLATIGVDEADFDESNFMSVFGDSDPVLRLQELELDGTAGGILFPNTGAFPLGRPADVEVHWAGIRAWNRYVADFASSAPERYAGTFTADLADIDRTCDEARWAREHDLRGGLFLGGFLGGGNGGPAFNSLTYEPLWDTLEEVGLPLVMHAAFYPGAQTMTENPGSLALSSIGLHRVPLLCGGPLMHFIFGEVFERHPRLRVVIAETGGLDWAIETKRQLDAIYENPDPGSIKAFDAIAVERNAAPSRLPRRPSEYFADHVWVQLHCHAKDWSQIHELGVENIVWGSDFPHAESSWPNSMRDLGTQFAEFGITRDDATTILRDNPAELFGFDLDALQPVADRIGPDFWSDTESAMTA